MFDTTALEQQIHAAMQTAQVPGLALAIIARNEVVYTQGFGVNHVEAGALPVTPDTLFRIGSVTKPLTGTLIMRLVEAGILDLETPIIHYLPDLRFATPDGAHGITLRHLLSHTAGLPTALSYSGPRDFDRFGPYLLKYCAQCHLIAPPGEVYSYSNPGIDLAGYVAEVVMGVSFHQLMRQWVFGPLGMERTTFDLAAAMTYPLALAHRLNQAGEVYVWRPFIENTGQHPCGFALSTANDLARLALMVLNNGKTGDETFLTVDAVTLMHSPIARLYTVDAAGYGITFRSWNYRGLRLVGHNGAIGKYGAWLALCPEQQAGIVMICNRAPNFWGEAAKILTAIWEQVLVIPAETAQLQKITPTPTMWSAHTGTYLSAESGLARLDDHNGSLKLEWNGQWVDLQAIRPDVYWGYLDDVMVSVGLLPGYLMVNGSMFKPVAALSTQPIPISPAYAGTFVNDLDEFRLRVDHDRLIVFSDDDQAEAIYRPITATRFASMNGTIDFQNVDAFIWANAFPFTRVR